MPDTNEDDVLTVATEEIDPPRPSEPRPDAGGVPTDDAVADALRVPTRAGIFRRLRTEGVPVSAREVAEMFGLHSNVARNHLDQLAEVGLLVTSRRKNSGGGRPARVYVAREQVVTTRDVQVPPGSQLGVHVVVQLIAGLAEHEAKLELLAEEHGRRMVATVAGRANIRDFEAAAVVAVEALRAAFPEVRLARTTAEAVTVEGLEVGLRLIGEVDGAVGDALARGFLRGALAAAGAAVTTTSREGRVTAHLDGGRLGATPTPTEQVDARGQTYHQGVAATMQAVESLRPGDHLEVLTDLQGAPAAFARWADRAGHELVDVTRIRDARGRQAVRLLLRKDTGLLAGTATA